MTAAPTVRLGDVATIERDMIAPEDIRSGTQYVGLEHVESSGRFVGVREVDAGDLASTKFAFNQSHVLYGKLRPYLCKIARPGFSGVCTTEIVPIKPGAKLDRDYLYHFLRLPRMVEFATSRCSGANLPRLSPKMLADFEIPLPPLAEQKRIAAVLDKADDLRAKRRHALATLDTLLLSVFLDMFGDPVTNPKGWPKVTLPQIVGEDGVFVDGDWVESKDQDPDGDVRLIQLADVGEGSFIDKSARFLKAGKAKQLRCTDLEPGDILIARMPDPLGRACLFPGLDQRCVTVVDVCIVRPDPHVVDARFLCQLLNTNGFRRELDKYIVGTTRQRISRGNLAKIQFHLPPLAEQALFATVMGKVVDEREKLLKDLDKFDNLFASLQTAAFAGTLFDGTHAKTAPANRARAAAV